MLSCGSILIVQTFAHNGKVWEHAYTAVEAVECNLLHVKVRQKPQI